MEISDNFMYTAMQRLILLHYQKILYVDLTDDFYSVLKVEGSEWNLTVSQKKSYKISDWFSFFAESGLCHADDKDKFRTFSDVQKLIEMFKENGDKPIRCCYRRRRTLNDGEFHPCTMEMYPYLDKAGHVIAFLFVREITDKNCAVENDMPIMSLSEESRLITHSHRDGKRKILVIDDNSINRSILVEFLKDEYDIVEANDGLVGLDILFYDYKSISAVILDLYMPIVNGFDFLLKMRDNPILASIPVLAATSSSEPGDEEKALALGASDFVSKPYSAAVVRMRLEKMIRAKEESALYSVSEYDSMTGDYTKEAFCHHIDMILGMHPEKKYDLVVSNIDNIHAIEELHGKNICSQVILRVSQSIKNCGVSAEFYGRIRDGVFAGFGEHSEEFTEEYFSDSAEKIAEACPVENVQIKFGVYKNVDAKISAHVLLGRAISVMDTIVRKYGNKVAYYDERIVEKQAREEAMENLFDSAIEKEDFEIWYQPKYSTLTQKITGAEALIRWRKKDETFISPAEFIPLFEKDGLIPILDEYVFKKVCKYQKSREEKGKPLFPISVNLSRASMFRKNFVRTYITIADEIGIDPAYVPIEITESMALKSSSFKPFAEALMKQGFSLHMDDFGSGYSSLSSLQVIHFEVIKFDKTLIDYIGTDRGDSLIRHTIAFAKESGMKVVAEGVETKTQMKFLLDAGCDYIQGFYFSPPVQSSVFEKLLNDNC